MVSANEFHSKPPQFLTLPAEIRLQIYQYLLEAHNTPIFKIRTLAPICYTAAQGRRTKYYIHTSNGRYSSSILTTYHFINPPNRPPILEEPLQPEENILLTLTPPSTPGADSIHDPMDKADTNPTSTEKGAYSEIYPAILAVCTQTYSEALPYLYRNHIFDFGTDIDTIVPFFTDLLPATRALVNSISLTKAASWRTTDFDAALWRYSMDFLALHCNIENLILQVVTAKAQNELEIALDHTPKYQYNASDFRTLQTVQYEALEWVRDLVLLRRRPVRPNIDDTRPNAVIQGWRTDDSVEELTEGLKELHVVRKEGQGPRVSGRISGAVAFYANFSRSLKGFEDYLREEMLGKEKKTVDAGTQL